MKTWHQISGTFLLMILATTALAAEKDHANVDGSHLGLKGYDPVSYFDGKPQPGDSKITAEYEGVIYRFASQDHLGKFNQDPAHYAPAYGGWCATAFAEDHGKVDIDPKSFKITDGRLYLFYKGLLSDARKIWVKDEPVNKAKADQNWKKLVGE